MYFQLMRTRLIASIQARVRNGEMTERRLARLTGLSQPHIHNILKGARRPSPEVADQILQRLGLTLLDLLSPGDLVPQAQPYTASSACRPRDSPIPRE